MRDQDQGRAAVGHDAEEEIHDLDARTFVEITGRFVGQDDRRTVDQGAGDGDALAFAAGKLRRQVFEARAETDLRKQRAGGRVRGKLRRAGDARGEATFSSAVSSGISW